MKEGLVRVVWLATCVLVCFGSAWAQDSEESEAQEREEFGETVVVTASRSAQPLHEAPATVSVLTSEQIEKLAGDDYGDLLRNVPGLNVSQMSARDIQISGRQATSSLATNQLVLVDGRTLYLDFFGFVMWDFMPVNPAEIEQVEVVRGPGSAVWGANAVSGVINVITKKPRDIAGNWVRLGGGELSTLFGSLTHAGATDKVGYKLSAGYYEQDPYDRPTGLIPGTSTPYPDFANKGTAQPKLDARVDFDSNPSTTWTVSGGYAETDGIIHSGIGPFDIEKADLGYFKVGLSKGVLQANFYANVLNGDASNLLTVGPDGRPIPLDFASDTYNLDFSSTAAFGGKHVLTYGGNVRRSTFDLSIAPNAEDRDEVGLFVQDEIFFNDLFRWVVGARWDDLDPIGSVVSPRTALIFSPSSDHTIRLTYNRAFRSPSVVNTDLDIVIVNQAFIDPAPFQAGLVAAGLIPPGIPCAFVLTQCSPFPYVFTSDAVGNRNMTEEQLDAFEVSYAATFDKGSFTISAYHNETKDQSDFFPRDFYGDSNPPPGWPLGLMAAPGVVLPLYPPAGSLPSAFSYRNVGEVTDEGLEVGIQLQPSPNLNLFLNYSYQEDPEVEGIDISETNIPPNHRGNLGLSYDSGVFFLNASLNYQDEAFWTDVLDSRFYGPTDSFTQFNVGAGVRLAGDKVTVSVNGQNITDETVQQHVFGDLISRKVTGQVSFSF